MGGRGEERDEPLLGGVGFALGLHERLVVVARELDPDDAVRTEDLFRRHSSFRPIQREPLYHVEPVRPCQLPCPLPRRKKGAPGQDDVVHALEQVANRSRLLDEAFRAVLAALDVLLVLVVLQLAVAHVAKETLAVEVEKRVGVERREGLLALRADVALALELLCRCVRVSGLERPRRAQEADISQLVVDRVLDLVHAPLDHVRRVRVVHVIVRALLGLRRALLELLPPVPTLAISPLPVPSSKQCQPTLRRSGPRRVAARSWRGPLRASRRGPRARRPSSWMWQNGQIGAREAV